jgi:hypothetical protein
MIGITRLKKKTMKIINFNFFKKANVNPLYLFQLVTLVIRLKISYLKNL